MAIIYTHAFLRILLLEMKLFICLKIIFKTPLYDYKKFYNLGIDGFFTGYPLTAYQLRDTDNYYN